MQYISLIYERSDEVYDLEEKDYLALVEQHVSLQESSIQKNTFVACSKLNPSGSAVSVRLRNGTPLITDGPFTESKEILVGFYAFDCPDLDDALQWASKIPLVTHTGVEVRPIDQNVISDSITINDIEDNTSPQKKSLFALLNYIDESQLEAFSENEFKQLIDGNVAMAETAGWAQEYVAGIKLMATATATRIDHHATGQKIHDGPFSEAKEVLLGLHVLSCSSIKQAINYAKTLPEASLGVVEVRPIDYHKQSEFEWNKLA